jgi:hypothetical protein
MQTVLAKLNIKIQIKAISQESQILIYQIRHEDLHQF